MSHPISGEAGAGDGLDPAGEITESIPLLRPEYASDKQRTLGEELHALYHKRDVEPSDKLDVEIARLRGKMRRGPRLHPGEFLADGKYRLIKRLGKDASSVRWLAFDRIEGRALNLRVMHADWVTDDDAVEAFTRRANELGQWQHSGIAAILDAGLSDEGFVFLASEYFGDTNLEEAVKQGTVDLTDALQIAVEVAGALQGAHEQGVIHGSVRPSSITVSDDGAAHLSNFDLSDGSTRDSSLFDAPESMQRGSRPGAQADVYSLGMTLMLMLHKDELPFWVLRDPGRLIDGLEAPETVHGLLHKAVDWDLDQRWPETNAMVAPILADAALVRSLAERALERGRLPVAAEHFERLLALEPDDAVALRGTLGDLYTRMEKFDEAQEHLLGALEAATRGPAPTAEPAARPLLELQVQLAAATGEWRGLADGLMALAEARDGAVATLLQQTAAGVYEDELDDPAAAVGAWTGVSANHQDLDTGKAALEARRRLAERLGEWRDYVTVSEALLPYLTVTGRAEVQYAIGKALLLHLDDEEAALTWLQRAEEEGQSLVDLADRLEEAWASRGSWDRVIDMMSQRAAEEKKKTEVSKILLRAGLIATSVHEEDLAIRVYRQLLDVVPDHTVALRHLARIHHRRRDQVEAEKLFDRLLSSFKGKNPKEPEASERAADYTAWARILLRQGRGDEAEGLLTEALRLQPNLIQGLRVAGPLYLDRGEPQKAHEMFDRQLTLYRAVDMSRAKTRASLGMGDVAWMQGRLTEAMGWANRALDVEPDEVTGWWGLARSAMSARGGHPGADRAPWLMAVPGRFTPHEALARLLAGVLDAKKAKKWLGRSGMGRGLAEGGDSPMRLACAVVDVLTRYQLVDPELFDRLKQANPEWEGPIDHVGTLWFTGELQIPVSETYAWSSRVVHRDFNPTVERELLAPPPELTGINSDELRKDDAWKQLLGGTKADAPPAPAPVPAGADDAQEDVHPEVVVDGARGRVLTLWSDSTEAQGRLGRVSVTLRRAGGAVYLESGKGLKLDGVPTTRARLSGGETLSAGNAAAILRLGGVGADAPIPDAPVDDDDDEAVHRAESTVDIPDDNGVAVDENPEPDAPEAVDEPADAEQPADEVPEPEPAVEDDAGDDAADDDEEAAAAAEAPSEEPIPELPDPSDDEETLQAPEVTPDELAAADAAAEEDDEVVVSPGRVVAQLARDEGDKTEPAVTLPVNPAAGHAQTILDKMTPPPAEPRSEDPVAEPDDAPEEAPVEAASEPEPEPAPEPEPEAAAEPEPVQAKDEAPPVREPPVKPKKPKGKQGSTIVPDPDEMAPAGRVEVMSGSARGTTADVGDKLVIGCGDSSGLVLSGDSRLGEEHCEVVRDGDRFVLRDLGTDAGTVINGQKVKERKLEGGEVIMVGRTVLRFLV